MPALSRLDPCIPVRSHAKRRSTLAILIAVAAGSSAVLFAVLSLSSAASSMPKPLAPSRPEPASGSELGAMLHQLGLAPERLAAAGVTPPQTTALVGNLRGYLEVNIEAIRSAESGYSTTSVLVDSLERTVRAGTASRQDREALTAARSVRASQAAARQALHDAAFTAAVSGLEDRVVQSLTLAAIGARWDLPLPYAFTERSEPDWVNLRDALSDQRINTKYGLEPSRNALEAIAAADAMPGVSAAQANLEANLAAVSAAWNLAVNP